MKSSTRFSMRDQLTLTKRLATVSLVIAAISISVPSYAVLGGTSDSVEADRARMHASLKIATANAYAIHEITTQTGTLIREYVSLEGRVFGVAWEGPFMPDMRQLLGGYFEHFSAAAKVQRDSHVGRRPLNIQERGLVVQTAGHMRAYSGRAYDPALLPAGVSANAVR
jgi:hypothetical protein